MQRRKLAWLRIVAAIALATLLGLCQMQSIARDLPGQVPGRWEPHLSPAGPVVVVVSVPRQRAGIYRNGIRIGSTPVSTGRPGYDTPVGVYPVLQKKREHYSNLYDDAPMPFMQRLTWSGIALHAGTLPGYPASHGCIRLPAAFAELLFDATTVGSLVIVTDSHEADAFLAPTAMVQLTPGGETGGAHFAASVSEEPVSLLLSTRDETMVVLQGGREIGRAPISIGRPTVPEGTTAYVLLEGVLQTPSAVLPGRPARPWMAVKVSDPVANEAPTDLAAGREVHLDPAFAAWVYDLVVPGTVLVVTSEPLSPHAYTSVPLMTDDSAPASPPKPQER